MKIKKDYKDDVRILFMDTVHELGTSVKNILIKDCGFTENNFIDAELTRFGNGEGKARLKESVRNKQFFVVTDVFNNSLKYKAYGEIHSLMPDEHFTDLKRIIAAVGGNAAGVIVVETVLYEGRQHRRNGRESLDCAVGLQELEKMNVSCITTFDAHSMDVRQAVPLMPFDNLIPTAPMLNEFITSEEINYENLIAISPDEGAMGRTRFYSGMLNCDIGMFYKRRDYSKVDEFGKNPIAEHAYLGKEIENGHYLIVDDMIASGGSIIDILEKLKNKKPKKVWVMATFALFTEGVDEFDKAYKEGILNKVYTTNFSYVPDAIKAKPWLKIVDCSQLLADYIVTYSNNEAITPLLNGRHELYERINELKNKAVKQSTKNEK